MTMRETVIERATSSGSGLRAGAQIDGVQLTTLGEQRDMRGSFTEIFQECWGLCIEPVQYGVSCDPARTYCAECTTIGGMMSTSA